MNILGIATNLNSHQTAPSLLIFEAYLRQQLLCDQLRKSRWTNQNEKKAAIALRGLLGENADELSGRLTIGMVMMIDRFPSGALKSWRKSLTRSLQMDHDHCEPLFRIAYELHRIQSIYDKLGDSESNGFISGQFVEQSEKLTGSIAYFENAIREWMMSDLNHGIHIESVVDSSEEQWTALWEKLSMQVAAALGNSDHSSKGGGGFHPLESLHQAFHSLTHAKSA